MNSDDDIANDLPLAWRDLAVFQRGLDVNERTLLLAAVRRSGKVFVSNVEMAAAESARIVIARRRDGTGYFFTVRTDHEDSA